MPYRWAGFTQGLSETHAKTPAAAQYHAKHPVTGEFLHLAKQIPEVGLWSITRQFLAWQCLGVCGDPNCYARLQPLGQTPTKRQSHEVKDTL